jgi:hypothetical protein
MDWARLLRIRRDDRAAPAARRASPEEEILLDPAGREPLLLTDFVEPERPSPAAP